MGFTCWLCQNSCGNWLFIVFFFPWKIVIFHSYVELPEGMVKTNGKVHIVQKSLGKSRRSSDQPTCKGHSFKVTEASWRGHRINMFMWIYHPQNRGWEGKYQGLRKLWMSFLFLCKSAQGSIVVIWINMWGKIIGLNHGLDVFFQPFKDARNVETSSVQTNQRNLW